MVGVSKKMPGVIYPPEDILKQYVDEGILDERTVAEVLIETLPKFGDKLAITGPEGDKTYAELDDESTRFAAGLLEMGLNPLDRVVFQVVNSKELLVALVACFKADLIPVCTLAAHRHKEISYLANHAGAKAHFIGIEEKFDFPAFATQMQEEISSLEHIVVVRGEGPSSLPHMDQLIAAQDSGQARETVSKLDRDPYQVAAFQLSGGTTSIPKIIPRFSNEYLLNFEALSKKLDYCEDDSFLFPFQIMHNAGMIMVMPAFLCGATNIVAASMDPMTIFGILRENKPTAFGVIPAALSRMKELNIRSMVDFSRTRFVFSPNAARQTEEVLGVPGIHIFGMTEGVVTFGEVTDPEKARYETIGTPLCETDEMVIVRPGTEEELPKGEVGELIIRGPYTFHGYYDAEDRNKETFTSKGYYRSGDLMSVRVIEGKDYYAFEGRLKDVVSRGGEKINCEEVELAARKHPGIGDIAIVAMPDPDYEERACAFVIPASGADAPDVKGLMEFLVSEGLAKFKCPERIEVVQDFPQTDSGKLSKPKLKVMIVDILARERVA